MDPQRKRRMFDALVKMGFKEIEVGFPSASQPDFDFVRQLIEEDLIPDDVTIQVLTQCREELIERTYEALAGAKQAIVHFYNSTNPLQREVVFGLDKGGIIDIAVSGAQLCKKLEDTVPGTHVPLRVLARELHAHRARVRDRDLPRRDGRHRAHPQSKLILNLPATVECYTPNVYADVIEWFGRHIRDRDSVVMSPAPAQRPWHRRGGRRAGCHGRRRPRRGHAVRQRRAHRQRRRRQPGDQPVRQGVDPELDITDIDALRRTAEYCNRLPVHERHPYVGDLVYTAFSGSHQDAIKKGFEALDGSRPRWRVPGVGGAVPAPRPEARRAAPTRPSSASTARAARAAWRT
jgi:2-isopropylmalate synthase